MCLFFLSDGIILSGKLCSQRWRKPGSKNQYYFEMISHQLFIILLGGRENTKRLHLDTEFKHYNLYFRCKYYIYVNLELVIVS